MAYYSRRTGCGSVIGFGLIVLVVANLMGHHGSTASSNASVTNTSTNTTKTHPAKTNNSTNNTSDGMYAPVPKIPVYSMGHPFNLDGFQITVNSVNYKKSIDDGTGTAPTAQNGIWLIVNVTIKNTNTFGVGVGNYSYTINKGSTIYNLSSDADQYVNNSTLFLQQNLNPGISTTGNLAFNVPNENSSYVLEIGSIMNDLADVKL